MNTRFQMEVWMHRTVIALGFIAAVSLAGVIILTAVGQPMPKILIAMAVVAIAGLARLLVSPLNQEWDE